MAVLRAGFLPELSSIPSASWCDAGHLGDAWLDRQPSESPSRLLLDSRLEGQHRWWLPACTGDAAPDFCKESAFFHPPFLTFLWWCDYSEGFPKLAWKSARLPCFWEVLNQKLPACKLFATDNLLADYFLLLVKCLWIAPFFLYTEWLFRCDCLNIWTPARPWPLSVEGEQWVGACSTWCSAFSSVGLAVICNVNHTAQSFRNTKATQELFQQSRSTKDLKYCGIRLPGRVFYGLQITRLLVQCWEKSWPKSGICKSWHPK